MLEQRYCERSEQATSKLAVWHVEEPWGMQQYEEQARLTSTSASHLSVVKGVNDGEKYVIKRVRIIPCKSTQHQVTLAYAVQVRQKERTCIAPNETLEAIQGEPATRCLEWQLLTRCLETKHLLEDVSRDQASYCRCFLEPLGFLKHLRP